MAYVVNWYALIDYRVVGLASIKLFKNKENAIKFVINKIQDKENSNKKGSNKEDFNEEDLRKRLENGGQYIFNDIMFRLENLPID